MFLLVAHLTNSPGGCPCARISGEALRAQGGRFRITPTIAVITATSLRTHCPPLPREWVPPRPPWPPKETPRGSNALKPKTSGCVRVFSCPLQLQSELGLFVWREGLKLISKKNVQKKAGTDFMHNSRTCKQPGALQGKMVKQSVSQPYHGILLRSEKEHAAAAAPSDWMNIKCSYAEWKRQTRER